MKSFKSYLREAAKQTITVCYTGAAPEIDRPFLNRSMLMEANGGATAVIDELTEETLTALKQWKHIKVVALKGNEGIVEQINQFNLGFGSVEVLTVQALRNTTRSAT